MKRYPNESIGRYISHLHKMSSSFLSKEYEQYEIGFGQYQFLVHLYLKDGLSHDELTDKVAVDKATTTRAIKKLEQLGYVKIVPNKNDKRKYFIYLTEKAQNAREQILYISNMWEHKLVGHLSPEELETLYILLRKIAKNNPGYFFDEDEKNNNEN